MKNNRKNELENAEEVISRCGKCGERFVCALMHTRAIKIWYVDENNWYCTDCKRRIIEERLINIQNHIEKIKQLLKTVY